MPLGILNFQKLPRRQLRPAQPRPGLAQDSLASSIVTILATHSHTSLGLMPSSGATPNNWPDDVIYLTQRVLAKSIQATSIQAGKGSTLRAINAPQEPYPSIKIKPITSPSHPASGQSGLFASRLLPPGSLICFYLGFVHGPDETDPKSDYDLSLDREAQIGVDATKMGNEARFINDYRGVRADGPNAEFRDCYIDIGRGVFERMIGVFVLGAGKGASRSKGIGKGEEILVSYGKGFWSHRQTVETARKLEKDVH